MRILERIDMQLRIHRSFSHGEVNLVESSLANSEGN